MAQCQVFDKKHFTQSFSIVNIKYFTARISPIMGNLDAPLRQSLYVRALKTLKDVEIEEGHFLTHIVYSPSIPEDCSYKNLEEILEKQALKTVRVLKREEKGTDVNLASYLLVDAFENKYKGAVILSNDSDLFTPMQIVKTKYNKKLFLISPYKRKSAKLCQIVDYITGIRKSDLQKNQFPETLTDKRGEFKSAKLCQIVDYITGIRKSDLQKNQFPETLTDKRGEFKKPDGW